MRCVALIERLGHEIELASAAAASRLTGLGEEEAAALALRSGTAWSDRLESAVTLRAGMIRHTGGPRGKGTLAFRGSRRLEFDSMAGCCRKLGIAREALSRAIRDGSEWNGWTFDLRPDGPGHVPCAPLERGFGRPGKQEPGRIQKGGRGGKES